MRIHIAKDWLEAISVVVAITGVLAAMTPKEFGHWEFMEMSCIGESASQDPHDYQVYHNGVGATKKTPSNPSLRCWGWLQP